MTTATVKHRDAFTFMTEQELQHIVPSAYTLDESYRSTSEYTKIHSPAILEQMKHFNWFPVGGSQMKAKLEKNKGFQKHFIRLRNPNLYIGDKNAIEMVAELLLVNSYDARCSCKIFIIIWRFACGNGAVVQSRELDFMMGDEGRSALIISHRITGTLDIAKHISEIDRNIKTSIGVVNKMKKVILDQKQQKHFAQEVCKARWDYMYKLHDTRSILTPLRDADKHNDLWTVFNLLQEKAVKGGWIGEAGRVIKPLTNPDRELLVNRRVFALAEEFLY